MQVSSSDTMCVVFFKQKTAYEMRISDWSSDVCSSDLDIPRHRRRGGKRGYGDRRGVEQRPGKLLHRPSPNHFSLWIGGQAWLRVSASPFGQDRLDPAPEVFHDLGPVCLVEHFVAAALIEATLDRLARGAVAIDQRRYAAENGIGRAQVAREDVDGKPVRYRRARRRVGEPRPFGAKRGEARIGETET